MPDRALPARAQLALWLAGVAVYSAYAWALPFVFPDEGYLYYLAAAVADGQVPFRDFHLQSYMPGLFYAFGGPVSLAGGSVLLPRLVMVPWLALTPVLACRCAWRMSAPPFAAAVAVVLLLVPGPWSKFYVAGLSLLVLESVLDLAGQGGRRVAFRAGAAVGLCLGLRIDVAIVGATLVGAATVLGPPAARRARLLAAATGATLAWSPFLLLLAGRGVLTDHFRQLAGFLPDVLRRHTGTPLAPPALPLPWSAGVDVFAVLFYASLVSFAGLAAVVARDRHEGVSRRGLLLLLAWAVLSAPAYVWERPDVPHFTQRAFCFLLPLAVVADRGWRRRAAPGRWRPSLGIAAAAGGALLAGSYVAFGLARGEGGSPSALWQPRREVHLSNGVSYWMAPHAMPPEMLERVLERTRPREAVASLPYYPGVNYLTRRPLPGRYVFLVPHVVTSPEVERRYTSDLARARYVVYLPGQSLSNTTRGLLPAYAPSVAARLREDFEVDLQQDGFVLLRRTAERSFP